VGGDSTVNFTAKSSTHPWVLQIVEAFDGSAQSNARMFRMYEMARDSLHNNVEPAVSLHSQKVVGAEMMEYLHTLNNDLSMQNMIAFMTIVNPNAEQTWAQFDRHMTKLVSNSMCSIDTGLLAVNGLLQAIKVHKFRPNKFNLVKATMKAIASKKLQLVNNGKLDNVFFALNDDVGNTSVNSRRKTNAATNTVSPVRPTQTIGIGSTVGGSQAEATLLLPLSRLGLVLKMFSFNKQLVVYRERVKEKEQEMHAVLLDLSDFGFRTTQATLEVLQLQLLEQQQQVQRQAGHSSLLSSVSISPPAAASSSSPPLSTVASTAPPAAVERKADEVEKEVPEGAGQLLRAMQVVWENAPYVPLPQPYLFYKTLYDAVLLSLTCNPRQLAGATMNVEILVESMVLSKFKSSLLISKIYDVLVGGQGICNDTATGVRLFGFLVELDAMNLADFVLDKTLAIDWQTPGRFSRKVGKQRDRNHELKLSEKASLFIYKKLYALKSYKVNDLVIMLHNIDPFSQHSTQQQRHLLEKIEISMLPQLHLLDDDQLYGLMYAYGTVGRIYPPMIDEMDRLINLRVETATLQRVQSLLWACARLHNTSAPYLDAAFNRYFDSLQGVRTLHHAGAFTMSRVLWSMAALEKLTLQRFEQCKGLLEAYVAGASGKETHMFVSNQLLQVWCEVQLLQAREEQEKRLQQERLLQQLECSADGTPQSASSHPEMDALFPTIDVGRTTPPSWFVDARAKLAVGERIQVAGAAVEEAEGGGADAHVEVQVGEGFDDDDALWGDLEQDSSPTGSIKSWSGLPWQARHRPVIENTSSSLVHTDASEVLRRMYIPHKNEVMLENGYTADVLIEQHAIHEYLYLTTSNYVRPNAAKAKKVPDTGLGEAKGGSALADKEGSGGGGGALLSAAARIRAALLGRGGGAYLDSDPDSDSDSNPGDRITGSSSSGGGGGSASSLVTTAGGGKGQGQGQGQGMGVLDAQYVARVVEAVEEAVSFRRDLSGPTYPGIVLEFDGPSHYDSYGGVSACNVTLAEKVLWILPPILCGILFVPVAFALHRVHFLGFFFSFFYCYILHCRNLSVLV
jgi:hypothetical protein